MTVGAIDPHHSELQVNMSEHSHIEHTLEDKIVCP